jgi:hypothetical protein
MIFRMVRMLFLVLTLFITLFLSKAPSSGEAAETWDEKYKSEPYVTLLKEVVITINRDYTFTEKDHYIERIQNQGGKDRGEITIGYDQSREEVTDIEAFTVMPDGTKKKYEKVQDLNSPQGEGVYSDERMKVITMPDVVPGNLIDWKATKVTKKPVIEGNFYDSFRFSCFCPIKEARYRITAPRDMKLTFKNLNHEIQPKIEVSGDTVTYTWEAQHVDKDDEEELMPSPEERYKKTTVSTLADWRQFSIWAWSLNQKNLKVSPEMKNKIRELTDGKNSQTEKIQAIIEYLRNDFRYVSMDIEAHSYEPHPSDEVFSRKYGDCKDQTLLAVAMLSELGVKAWPVLMSTSSDLNRRDLLPMPVYFDHVIVALEFEGARYYTDILLKGYHFQTIPIQLAGKRVFIVNDAFGEFASIPFPDKAEIAMISDQKIRITDRKASMVEVNLTLSRGLSTMLKEKFKTLNTEDREKFLSAFVTTISQGGKVLDRQMKNADVPYSPISFSLQFEQSNLVQQAGDMLMFGMPPLTRPAMFSSPKRRYPIVFHPNSELRSTISYAIPEGYEVASLPQKVFLDNAFSTYVREYSIEGAHINGKEVLLYKQAIIPASEYQMVRNFFDEMPGLTNDKIVIKKKPSSK